MNHCRQPATSSEVDLTEPSANGSQHDNLPREEPQRPLEVPHHSQAMSTDPAARNRNHNNNSTITSSTACTSAMSSGTSNSGHLKLHQSPLTATTVSTPPLPPPPPPRAISKRGSVVTWDSAKVRDVEDHIDKAWRSPSDLQERSNHTQISLRSINVVLSTESSHRASTSTMLPSTSTAISAVMEPQPWNEFGEEVDDKKKEFTTTNSKTSTATAGVPAHGEADAVAAAPTHTTATAADKAGTNDKNDAPKRDTAAAAAATMKAPVSNLQAFSPFSPLSNASEFESVTSPRSAVLRAAAANFASAAMRLTHSVAGVRGANRYSGSSMSSSTYETVDNSVTEISVTSHIMSGQMQTQQLQPQNHQNQQQLHETSLQPAALTFSTLPVSHNLLASSSGPNNARGTSPSRGETPSPMTFSSGADGGGCSSAPLGSEVSLCPAQLETLPPPLGLSLHGARPLSSQHLLSPISSINTLETPVRRHHLHSSNAHDQQQQEDEQPFLLDQALQQARNTPSPRPFLNTAAAGARASNGTVMNVTVPANLAAHLDQAPSAPISSSSHTNTGTTIPNMTATSSTTSTSIGTSESSSNLSVLALMPSSTPRFGPSRSFVATSPQNSPERRTASAAAVFMSMAGATSAGNIGDGALRNSIHADSEVTVVPSSSLLSAVIIPLPENGSPFVTPTTTPVLPTSNANTSSNNAATSAAAVRQGPRYDDRMWMLSSMDSILCSLCSSPAPSASAYDGNSNNSFPRQSSPIRSQQQNEHHNVPLAPDPTGFEESPHRPRGNRLDGSNSNDRTSPQMLLSSRLPTSRSSVMNRSDNNSHYQQQQSQGTPTALDGVRSPQLRGTPASSRHTKNAAAAAAVTTSTNTLVSVDTTRMTVSPPPIDLAPGTTGSGEFKKWTHIVSWDKDGYGHFVATKGNTNYSNDNNNNNTGGTRDRSGRAVLNTATSSPLLSTPLDGRSAAPTNPSAPSTESPSPQQDSVLAPSSLSSSGQETTLTRARQTASLRRVRHASTGYRYINNYRIIKSLGRGSCGKVKLAYDETESRLVAIKNVRRADTRKRIGGLTTAQKQYNSFMREIEVMKKLRHRNIVSLYEVIDDPSADKLYLVMQYVDKGMVSKVEVRANSDYVCDPIPPAQLARYAREMLTGLQYLHRHNVVHRDLKPDNILVSKDGHAYLADFGVAETFDTSYRKRRESMMAQSRAMSLAMSTAGNRASGPQVVGTKGTPLFLAPELWDGAKSYGKPVDMWAMGVTLFTLLVGKLPFRSPEDICDSTFLPTVPEEFGEKWRTLLNGLLNRNPQARWTVEAGLKYVKVELTGKEHSSHTNNNINTEANVSKTLLCSAGAANLAMLPPSATVNVNAASTPVKNSSPGSTKESPITFSTDAISSNSKRNATPPTATPATNMGTSSGAKQASTLRVLGPLRCPSSSSVRDVSMEPCSPSLVVHQRAPQQQTSSGNPRNVMEEAVDTTFRNTTSSYPTLGGTDREQKISRFGLPAATTAASAAEHHQSAPRPHGLEVSPVQPSFSSSTVTRRQLGNQHRAPTHPPATPERPLSSQPYRRAPRKHSSSGESADCPEMPCFEDSASDIPSGGNSMFRGENSEEAEATMIHPQPHSQSHVIPIATAYRPFATRRTFRLPPETQLGTNADPPLTQHFSDGVSCRTSLSADPIHPTSPWLPVSATPTTPTVELMSITSSHIPPPTTVSAAAAAAEEVGGGAGAGATSLVHSSVLSLQLLPPSVPRPYSSRLSEKDESLTVPGNASASTASLYLTATYHSRTFSTHSKDERGNSLTRPVGPPYCAVACVSSGISRSSSSSSSSVGRAMHYSPSTRNSGGGGGGSSSGRTNLPVESRERRLSLTPLEGTMSGTNNADQPIYPRSPPRLPGITPNATPIPTPPSCMPISAALPPPLATRPIRAMQPRPQSPSRPLTARSPRTYSATATTAHGVGGGEGSGSES